MSRLYMKIKSDTHKTVKTISANEDISIELQYGSNKDSKLWGTIEIKFVKGADKPYITALLKEKYKWEKIDC